MSVSSGNKLDDLNFNIAARGNKYHSVHEITMPDNMELVSYDHGVVDTKIKKNGMRVVVVPFGKSGSAMMRRLVVGGSRLENSKWAGSCHVLEHCDFRLLYWLAYEGMDKNAATSKMFIEHQTHLLLDPQVGHLKKELEFQLATMRGDNLVGLTPEAIRLEILNVLDEKYFNSQKGSAYRLLITAGEEALLKRVWASDAWTAATIGDKRSLSNITSAEDLLHLHRAFRAPQRTYLVLAGAVDVNATLSLLGGAFGSLERGNEHVLKPLPLSTLPSKSGRAVANVSANSGMSAISISGLKSAYGKSADAGMILQHLVGMLGSQPALQEYGVKDVTMYMNPEQEAGTWSILAKLSNNDCDEEHALLGAQHAIERHIMEPLRHFNDQTTLSALLTQYREKVHDTLHSGPQETAALAIQGILACDKPSLSWHVNDRFSDDNMTPDFVRSVAQRMFDSDQLAVVRCTRAPGSAGLAPAAPMAHRRNLFSMLTSFAQSLSSALRMEHTPVAFHNRFSTAHLAADTNARSAKPPQYVPPSTKSRNSIILLRNKDKDHIASAAFNTITVSPVSKKTVTCYLGNASDYNGWAQSMLAAEGMNTVSKIIAGGRCEFKVEGSSLLAEVNNDHMPPGTFAFTQPLVSCVALAAALTGAVPGINGLGELREQLPGVAFAAAVKKTQELYDSPVALASAQTRSQMCAPVDPGYRPASLDEALQALNDSQPYVMDSLRTVATIKPRLAGTNTTYSELSNMVQSMGEVGTEARNISARLPVHTIRKRLQEAIAPDITMVQMVSGLQTYPYVAAVCADKPLQHKDRAALIVSRQVMAGGMGSVYTHDMRQRGLSYRPSGDAPLSWASKPVLMLNATFDAPQAHTGSKRTVDRLRQWCTGDSSAFTAQAVQLAKQSLLEKIQLTSMEYDAQKYSLLADMDPTKLASGDVHNAINAVTSRSVQSALKKYFGRASIKESWVAANPDVVASS